MALSIAEERVCKAQRAASVARLSSAVPSPEQRFEIEFTSGIPMKARAASVVLRRREPTLPLAQRWIEPQ